MLHQHGVPVVVQTLEAVVRDRVGHATNNRFSSSGWGYVADTWPVPRVQHRVRVLLTCHHCCVCGLSRGLWWINISEISSFYDSSSLIRKDNFNVAAVSLSPLAGCWLLPWAVMNTCHPPGPRHNAGQSDTNFNRKPGMAAKFRICHWSRGGGGWDQNVFLWNECWKHYSHLTPAQDRQSVIFCEARRPEQKYKSGWRSVLPAWCLRKD